MTARQMAHELDDAYGMRSDIVDLLRANDWPVPGVFVGGCVSRGIGSSFHAMAHTHTSDENDLFYQWICVRSPKRLLTPAGQPTRLLRHEVAHVIAPKAGHGSRAFIAALGKVGIQTDSYSAAGRRRAKGGKA